MGLLTTEQAVLLIDAVGDAIPDPVMRAEPNMNFWPLLVLAIIPVILGVWLTWWLNKRRKKK